MASSRVRVHVLPGGKMPQRQTDGAIGFDVYLRAIVSDSEMDPGNSKLRKTIFDFKVVPRRPKGIESPRNFMLRASVKEVDNEIVYRLKPGESVLVGIGFTTDMKFPMFYWVAPRSGLASKWKITVTNAPGTVDPDYRGEAGVLVHNRGDKPFDLKHNMRIAQIIFQEALIPDLVPVAKYGDLSDSKRGAGGFGSTGLT